MKLRDSIIIVLCCVCLAGCTGTAREKNTQEKEREELVLWSYYETDNQKKSMDELVDGFNASQDQYYLRWEYYGPVTEFSKKLAIGITQNQLPDLAIIDNPTMPSYIEMDMLEDITEAVKEIKDWDQYFPTAKETVECEGRYYGLPFCCNNVALIYNKDILEEEQIAVPKNWDELEAAAGSLTKEGRYGFAMSAVSGEQGAFQFAAFMLSAGDELNQAGGEGTRRAFQFIQDMVRKGYMSKECVNWSQNDVARTFISGECVLMENGPWVFPALDEAGINYGVAAFPANERYKSVLGGENIVVMKGKNKEGSIAFLQYYGQTEAMLNANLRANSLPPKRDVAELFLKVKPEYAIIREQMENCISRTSYEKWSKLSEQLTEGQYEIITGNDTPEGVCRQIREEIAP